VAEVSSWRRQGYYYVLAGWIDKTELGTLAAEVAPELDRRRALEGVTPRAAVNSSIRSEASGESQGWPALPLAESHTGKI